MHSLTRPAVAISVAPTRCCLCRRLTNPIKTPTPKLSFPQTRAEFIHEFLSPYQLPNRLLRPTWLQRAFHACLASGCVYGLCRLWEAHQAQKANADSLRTPMLQPGGPTSIARWTLVGPYALALLASSCIFAVWRFFRVSAGGVGGRGLVRMNLRGAVQFLRFAVDRPGLSKIKYEFSRPMLSPLGSALSHKGWPHFLISQVIFFGCVTNCIGKQSPGEFVSFCVTAAYVTSLASATLMCLTSRFAYSIGASGVLSALVAYNALTIDETHRFQQSVGLIPETAAADEPLSGLALLGIIPLPASIPAGAAVAAWAGVEVALLARALLWLRRLPTVNHAAHLAGIAFGAAYAWCGHWLLWSNYPVPPLKPPQRMPSALSSKLR